MRALNGQYLSWHLLKKLTEFHSAIFGLVKSRDISHWSSSPGALDCMIDVLFTELKHHVVGYSVTPVCLHSNLTRTLIWHTVAHHWKSAVTTTAAAAAAAAACCIGYLTRMPSL